MKNYVVSTHRSLRDISNVFAQYLWQHENMEINRFVMPDGEFRVQGRIRNNTLHHLLGWDIRIVIKLHRENEQKIIVALGMLVRTHNIYAVILSVLLLPLLLVSLWGKIYQHLLLFRMQKMIKSLK